MNNSDFLRIMQLADSALPVGGFAFSGGLEWMIKSSTIVSREEFSEYIRDLIAQIGAFDFPFINSFISLPEEQRHGVLQEYDLLMYTPLVRNASLTQGRAWRRLLPRLGRQDLQQDLKRELTAGGNNPHYLFLLARSLNDMGYTRETICCLYGFMILRDQISAAVRLGSIGPGLAQELQSEFFPEIEEAIASSVESTHSDAFRITPMIEMAQGAHETLYSKLFQN